MKFARQLFAVGLSAALFLPAGAAAQENIKQKVRNAFNFSDREHRDQWEKEKQELARLLKSGEGRDFYRRQLEKAGYNITSVNYDKADYIEYEVVKGDRSYEVQIDLDAKSNKANKVEVAPNLWQAENTKQALRGRKTQVSRKDSSDKNNARYSDRDRKDEWEKRRNELANALKPGQERDYYRRQLEKLGYTITAVNHDKPEYVEYEIVKGDQTYEVQVDFDKNSPKATKVEVASNMWKAEATEKALNARGAKKS
jgi:uncharacterized protein YmfQ (DUF2313 family)